MSAKEDKIEVDGTVIKSLPGGIYEVRLDDAFCGGGVITRVYMSGRMRRSSISLTEGDGVVVELTPYDISKGRVIFRKR